MGELFSLILKWPVVPLILGLKFLGHVAEDLKCIAKINKLAGEKN